MRLSTSQLLAVLLCGVAVALLSAPGARSQDSAPRRRERADMVGRRDLTSVLRGPGNYYAYASSSFFPPCATAFP
jgi:hypothetical protein